MFINGSKFLQGKTCVLQTRKSFICLRDIGTPRQVPKPILYHLAWPNIVKSRAPQRRDLFASRMGVLFPSSDNSQPLGVEPISCSRYCALASGLASDSRRRAVGGLRVRFISWHVVRALSARALPANSLYLFTNERARLAS